MYLCIKNIKQTKTYGGKKITILYSSFKRIYQTSPLLKYKKIPAKCMCNWRILILLL